MTSATTTTQPQRGGPQLTLRFRKGSDLLAWYQQLAKDNGVSLTAALLVGLDHYRAAHDNGGLTLTTAHDGRTHLA
jgi:hypothetical protein